MSTHINVADALTKHVDSGKLNSHMISVGLVITTLRRELMPESSIAEVVKDSYVVKPRGAVPSGA